MDPEVAAKLSEHDARLYAQEHRVGFILWNFLSLWWVTYTAKQKEAIYWAFVCWSIRLIVPTPGGTTSIVAVFALVVAIWAAYSAHTQTLELKRQTQESQKQTVVARVHAVAGHLPDVIKELARAPAGEKITNALYLDIRNLAESLEPYEGDLVPGRVLSRERGNLLRSLVNSPADTSRAIADSDFSASYLPDARFAVERPILAEAYLEGSVLERALLSRADLHEAFLKDANLQEALLDGCDLRDADLSFCNLRGADLRNAVLAGADLRGATLDRVIVDRLDWLEYITTLDPPARIEAANWRVISEPRENSFRLESAIP